MRKRLVLGTVIAALAGAVVAVVGVVAAHWWTSDNAGGNVGFTSYSPLSGSPQGYASKLVIDLNADWTDLIAPAALSGAVAGLVLGAIAFGLYRRFGANTAG